MEKCNTLIILSLLCCYVLIFSGCGNSGNTSGTVHHEVYQGYSHGYNGYYYADDHDQRRDEQRENRLKVEHHKNTQPTRNDGASMGRPSRGGRR